MASQLDGLQVSGSVHGNFTCTWTIERFSSLDSGMGKYHESGVFTQQETIMECYLWIYPGGCRESNEGYLSCFLYRKNKLPAMKLKLNLSLRNKDGVILFDGIDDKWNDFSEYGRGYLRTVKTTDLASQLVDDILVVIVKATYCATCIKDEFGTCRFAEVYPTVKITENLRNLWKSKENTDCVISVEGENIPAHSLILGTHSKVFAAMFNHNTVEKDTRCVKITDFGKDTMNVFLEFLYSGDVDNMNSDLALELLRAGDKYEVSHLKLYCTNYLKSHLNRANVCQALASADIHNAKKLRRHAIKYVLENLTADDLEAQRSTFVEQPEQLLAAFKHFLKKRKREDNDY